MEIYWGPRCQIYLTPVSRAEICVVVISRDSHIRLDRVLRDFPELECRLNNAIITTTERGAVSASHRLASVGHGRVMLVGDASGSVDAITGDGLRLGFEQGLALADAIAGGDLKAYGTAHRRLARRPSFMSALMLLLDRSPWLRRRALSALSSEPRIFATQLAMHVGAVSTAGFVWHSMLPLGRNILTESTQHP
jgi:flavin-dependent dehydrogenase